MSVQEVDAVVEMEISVHEALERQKELVAAASVKNDLIEVRRTTK